MSDRRAELERLSREESARLLLFAWHSLRVAAATDAQLIALDHAGFRLRVFAGTKSTDCVHLFSSNEETAGEAESCLRKALSRKECFRFPPNSTHALAVVGILALGATPVEALPFFLHSAKRLLMLVVRSETIALAALGVAAFLHLLEALYVAYVMAGVTSSSWVLLTWAVLTLLLGYPCTSRAITLSRLRRAAA